MTWEKKGWENARENHGTHQKSRGNHGKTGGLAARGGISGKCSLNSVHSDLEMRKTCGKHGMNMAEILCKNWQKHDRRNWRSSSKNVRNEGLGTAFGFNYQGNQQK